VRCLGRAPFTLHFESHNGSISPALASVLTLPHAISCGYFALICLKTFVLL
jgi:hypothetical protein